MSRPHPHRLALAAALLACALLRPVPARGAPSPTPRELLRQAIDLYVVGKYAEAASRLRPLVESRVLEDRADQREALRTYGIALYLSGARPGAERAFRELLRLDPEARLDPSFVRPEVVQFFKQVRHRHRLELRTVVRKSPKMYKNFLPPWGQFQNGQRTKGWILGSAELLTVATSVATAALLYSWRRDDGTFGEHEAAAEVLQPVNWVSFGALGALLLYGVIDGVIEYRKRPPEQPAVGQRALGGTDPTRARSQGAALLRF